MFVRHHLDRGLRAAVALLGCACVGRAAEPVTNTVSLPLEFRDGQIYTTGRLNGSGPLTFLLDTGYEMTMVHPRHVEPLGLRRDGKVTIVGIAGDEEADVLGRAGFDFGGLKYAPRRVASLPSETRRRRQRDGILGSGFFRRFVVEIDPAARQVRLHEPARFQYAGNGTVVPLDLKGPIPVVQAVLVATNGVQVRGRFQIDTGCSGSLCVGSDFTRHHQLAPGSGQSGTRSGVGGDATVRTTRLARLQLGDVAIDRPAANFFIAGSPVNPGLAGHIGWDALRRHRVIFDYGRQRMVVEPPGGQ